MVCTWEALLGGRPGGKIQAKIHTGRSQAAAILYTTGKPDSAGDPEPGSTYTWKPVYAGGLMVCVREALQSGRPGDKTHCKIHGSRSMPEAIWYTSGKPNNAGGRPPGYTHTWKPVYAGGLMMRIREARQSGRPGDRIQCKIHGGRSMPEAVLYTTGRPDNAGGPRQDQRRHGRRYRPKPYRVTMGSPTQREARRSNTR